MSNPTAVDSTTPMNGAAVKAPLTSVYPGSTLFPRPRGLAALVNGAVVIDLVDGRRVIGVLVDWDRNGVATHEPGVVFRPWGQIVAIRGPKGKAEGEA